MTVNPEAIATSEETIIHQSHIIDDLEKKRATMYRAIGEQLPMLEDARHALLAGRYEVVEEFLERSVEALRKAREGGRWCTS